MAAPIGRGASAPPPDFIAVDVETANRDAASICQIGFASFAGARLLDNWSWLINPQTWFSTHNIAVHGIHAADVAEAPTWGEVLPQIVTLFADRIVVSHTAFDVTAIGRASERIGQPPPAARWLDSARVARRAYPQFARRGFGLGNLSRHLGIEFAHHDAGEDARAAGYVVLAAVAERGIGVADWLTESHRPLQAFV